MRTLPAGVCLLALGTLGCWDNSPEKPEPKPPEVKVTEAVGDWITDYEEFTGRTESRDMVFVKARVQGYLKSVHFQDGDLVWEGDVLFEIDPALYDAELERAKAARAQNQARLERLEKDYQRALSLDSSNGISKEE